MATAAGGRPCAGDVCRRAPTVWSPLAPTVWALEGRCSNVSASSVADAGACFAPHGERERARIVASGGEVDKGRVSEVGCDNMTVAILPLSPF
eukprot:gene4429-33083_t